MNGRIVKRVALYRKAVRAVKKLDPYRPWYVWLAGYKAGRRAAFREAAARLLSRAAGRTPGC